MLIDCTHCQARVNAELLKLAAYRDSDVWTNDYQIALLRCPECKHLLVSEQLICRRSERNSAGFAMEEDEWLPASRVWPEPVTMLPEVGIPDKIQACLAEAQKCLHATAFTACVAMSGRALEAMCRHFGTQKDKLFEGLKELHLAMLHNRFSVIKSRPSTVFKRSSTAASHPRWRLAASVRF